MSKSVKTVYGVVTLLVAAVTVYSIVLISSPISVVSETYAQNTTVRVTGWLWNGADECSDESYCTEEDPDAGMGWVSLNCENHDGCSDSDYGVEVDTLTGDISGYAWSGNGYGWISFSETGTAPDGSDAEMRITPDYEITGWARILSMGDDGWIKFDGVNYDDDNGDITGYGWHAVPGPVVHGFGWFKFVNANGPHPVDPNPPYPDSLDVTLVADPDFSEIGFTPDLIAEASDGDSPYSYSFKCDHSGQPEDIIDWISNDSDTYSDCTYGGSESGIWTAWVRVEDDDDEVEYASDAITVCFPGDPACNLIGCHAEVDGKKLTVIDSILIGTPVTWVAEQRDTAVSTTGFNWDGTPGLNDSVHNSTGITTELTYETVGIKEGSVENGGKTVECDAGFHVIVDPEFEEL